MPIREIVSSNRNLYKLVFLFSSITGLILGVFLVLNPLDILRQRAATSNSLYIRVSKSYVEPGDSYKIYVLDSKMPSHNYHGELDVTTTYCDEAGSNCRTYTGVWRDYNGDPIIIEGGSATINVPNSAGRLITKSANFRPRPNPDNFDWSNEISMSIGTRNGLEKLSDYWTMSDEEYLFKGTNFTYSSQIDFDTVIGYKSSNKSCSPGKVMYFIKNKRQAYWDPATPWFEDRRVNPGTDQLNLFWYLTNLSMDRKSGWHDYYLHAYGDERFEYETTEPLTLNSNFNTKNSHTRYLSNNSIYPPYFLGPKYIGKGWGDSNNRATTNRGPDLSFCEIPTKSGASFWSVHADFTSIDGYDNVLRLKYYEGDNYFTLDSSKYGLREDWYFAKNVGLVRIDTKNFCPNVWDDYSKCEPCPEDPDCTLNEYIQNPHVTLSRVGINDNPPIITNTPTPTNTPRPTATDTPRPTATNTPRPTATNTPRPTVTNTPVPTPTPPASPTNLNPEGTTACGLTSLTFRWDSFSGATGYAVRVDDRTNGWNGSCTDPNSGDSCRTQSVTSYSRSVVPGRTYRWWVHSINSGGWSDPTYQTVEVPVCPTNTPTPTNTPRPTRTPTPTDTPEPTATNTPQPTQVQPTNTPQPTDEPVVGDANGDDRVDGIDFTVWLNNYNTITSDGVSDGDFNEDDRVDGIDFTLWLNNYGT